MLLGSENQSDVSSKKRKNTSVEKIIQVTHDDMVAIRREELQIMSDKASKEIEIMSKKASKELEIMSSESQE